jgi:hypothetical protein
MATIHVTQSTTATPEQFIAALTDFGPGRAELFGNSADEFMKVHDRSADGADVTEGSSGIWERLHYDWSQAPERVVLTTTDSNTWANSSGFTYTFESWPDGTTLVDVVVVRNGKTVKGHVIGALFGVIGKRFLGGGLKKTVAAVEARAASGTTAGEDPA